MGIKEDIDQIKTRVTALEKEYLRSEVTLGMLTTRLKELKERLLTDHQVSTLDEAKVKILVLKENLQEELERVRAKL